MKAIGGNISKVVDFFGSKEARRDIVTLMQNIEEYRKMRNRYEPINVPDKLRKFLEATEGIEPPYTDLQSAASPLRHVAPWGWLHKRARRHRQGGCRRKYIAPKALGAITIHHRMTTTTTKDKLFY